MNILKFKKHYRRILYQAKLFFKDKGEIRTFWDDLSLVHLPCNVQKFIRKNVNDNGGGLKKKDKTSFIFLITQHFI